MHAMVSNKSRNIKHQAIAQAYSLEFHLKVFLQVVNSLCRESDFTHMNCTSMYEVWYLFTQSILFYGHHTMYVKQMEMSKDSHPVAALL